MITDTSSTRVAKLQEGQRLDSCSAFAALPPPPPQREACLYLCAVTVINGRSPSTLDAICCALRLDQNEKQFYTDRELVSNTPQGRGEIWRGREVIF